MSEMEQMKYRLTTIDQYINFTPCKNLKLNWFSSNKATNDHFSKVLQKLNENEILVQNLNSYQYCVCPWLVGWREL